MFIVEVNIPSLSKKQLTDLGIMPEVTAEDQKILEDPEAYPDYLGINYYHGGTVQQNRLEKQVDDQKMSASLIRLIHI